MEENLLTAEQIQAVEKEARFSLLNNPGFIAKFSKGPLDVYSISWGKKLIFIWGNEYTGLTHIKLRHDFYTNEHSLDGKKFFKTSRFDPKAGGLFDFCRIAEALYDEAYKDPKNNHPDVFDVYKGAVEATDQREFRLILYKGTKIVHTLFPIEKKKKKTAFRRGDIIVKWVHIGIYIGVIPYFDADNQVRYGIGVKTIVPEQREEWSILIYENGVNTKTVALGQKKVECTIATVEFHLQKYNYADVSKMEDVIARVEKGEIKEAERKDGDVGSDAKGAPTG